MSAYPDASFITSAHDPQQFIADDGTEVAFAGRSNAGKSSAINMIVNRRSFARTSKSPGRTQLVNFFALAPGQRLVDLPGYGFARVSKSVRDHWRGLLQTYFDSRQSLAGTFIIVDSRRGLGDFDFMMLDMCASIGCPVHVLLTKADKLKKRAAADALAAAQQELGDAASVQLFSALKGTGVDDARAHLDALLAGGGPKKSPG